MRSEARSCMQRGHTYTARIGLNYKLSPVYEPLK